MRNLLYDILLENANIDYSDAGFGLIATAVLQALAEAADEDHNILLRGGLGLFTGRVPFVWMSNQYSNSGVDQVLGHRLPSERPRRTEPRFPRWAARSTPRA